MKYKKMRNFKNEKVKDIDMFFDDLCDLIQEYFPMGWVSKNDQLFFDDEELMEDFDKATELLIDVIKQTKDKNE